MITISQRLFKQEIIEPDQLLYSNDDLTVFQYDDGDMVRSTVIGESYIDKKERLASVTNIRTNYVPKPDDIVIGTVEAVMGSMIAVLIKYINSKPVQSQVECICATRNIRKKYVALVNDLVKLRIIGTLNGATHAAMNSPELGVLFT